MKRLEDMTLEELWELFPIRLTPHSEEWKIWYAEEEAMLKRIFPNAVFSHIGSTAIEGIYAKPTVDILAEFPTDADLSAEAERFKDSAGYLVMSRSQNRISLNKGYTESGYAPRVFHLHMRYAGDNDEIYFRDLLNARPEIAKEYENLKLSLWKPYEHDRDGYTEAKTDFVKKYTEIAKQNVENQKVK